jgi:hypothetical protein
MKTAAYGQVLRYQGPRSHGDLVAARALSLGFVLTQFAQPSRGEWITFTASLPGPIRWVELISLVEVLAHTSDPYALETDAYDCQEIGLLAASG